MGLLGNGAIGLLLDIIGQPFRVDFRVAIYMMDKYLSLLFSFSRSAQSPRFVFPILIPFPIPFIFTLIQVKWSIPIVLFPTRPDTASLGLSHCRKNDLFYSPLHIEQSK